MITIEQVRLDLQMDHEAFATELYGKWDGLYPTIVEKVIDDVLCRYDDENEVLRLESVSLDLGEIEEPEFYRQFPKRLAEKLNDFFADCLKSRGKYPLEIIPVYTDKTEILLFFLLYGFFPQGTPAEFRDFSVLLKETIENNGAEFIRLLKENGNVLSLRKRLAYQFSDEELESVVKAAEPSEAMFIQVYVRYLIVSHDQLGHPEVTAQDHRHVVWQVVLAYLLYDSGSYFSRKQMVAQTVRGLAAHFNIDFFYLLQLLTAGLDRFTEKWLFVPELLAIFSDLKQELVKDMPEIGVAIDIVRLAKEFSSDNNDILCRLLSRPDSCRRFLAPLKEEEIIRLVEWIIPEESTFIIEYARSLDQEKEKGMLEGKAGSEFRLLKWEFLFLVLLDSPVSFFHRTRFVMAVISRLARHYNLDVLVLLSFLCADTEGLPVYLAEILKELYETQINNQWREVLSETGEGYGEKQELFRLTAILSHSVTARRFLQNISELQIYRLTELIIPSESAFIISYARSLDQEKERGMLEGRAGQEFRLLKWEFMFLVILSVPVSEFNRKYFVRSVLCQLAAHYNLAVYQLLNYFIRDEIKSGLPENLLQVITELWEEEKIQAVPRQTGTNLYFENMFAVLSKRAEIPEQMWEKAGIEFVMGLLQNYRQPEVTVFIKKWKKQIWAVLFHSVKHTELLREKVSMTQGLWNYLIAEYGEEILETAFIEKHLDCSGWKNCNPVVWGEILKRGDMTVIFWWLNNKPEFVREMWRQCPAGEEQQRLKGIAGNSELQQIWLEKLGRLPVRQIEGIFMELNKRYSFFPDKHVWLSWLLPYIGKRYENFSVREIVELVWQKLMTFLSVQKYGEIVSDIKGQTGVYEFKILQTMIQENHLSGEQVEHKTVKSWRFDEPKTKKVSMGINNAGLVLLSPYFSILFRRIGYIPEGNFETMENRIRAAFLLQYMLYERCEFQESELLLNKLLTGCGIEQEFPKKIELTEEEKKMGISMLEGAVGNWKQMENTSLDGFRHSFLSREGILQENEDFWQLGVETRGYDVLLDSLPWSYSPVKFPWMEKPIYVNWRN